MSRPLWEAIVFRIKPSSQGSPALLLCTRLFLSSKLPMHVHVWAVSSVSWCLPSSAGSAGYNPQPSRLGPSWRHLSQACTGCQASLLCVPVAFCSPSVQCGGQSCLTHKTVSSLGASVGYFLSISDFVSTWSLVSAQ